jgi:hypothetical protein
MLNQIKLNVAITKRTEIMSAFVVQNLYEWHIDHNCHTVKNANSPITLAKIHLALNTIVPVDSIEYILYR